LGIALRKSNPREDWRPTVDRVSIAGHWCGKEMLAGYRQVMLGIACIPGPPDRMGDRTASSPARMCDHVGRA
jgi:hypothetical protein